jgi:hypothetical protein
MSASDHLSKNQFRLFHGTNRKSIKGGVINPTKQRGEEWDGTGPTAAFASTRPDEAATYGKNVYEVHPTGKEEHVGDHAFMSDEGFKVKRQLKPEVVERYGRIVGPIHKANFRKEHYANVVHQEHGPDGVFRVEHDENGNVSKRTKIK